MVSEPLIAATAPFWRPPETNGHRGIDHEHIAGNIDDDTGRVRRKRVRVGVPTLLSGRRREFHSFLRRSKFEPSAVIKVSSQRMVEEEENHGEGARC